MKKYRVLALTGLLLASAQMLTAQTLTAYHVVGEVKYTEGGKDRPVVNNTKLTPQSQISIPYGGKLELLDEKNSKRIILRASGTGKIQTMMSTAGNSAIDLSERYVAYVKKQLTNKKGIASKERYTDFATVTREAASADDQKKEKSFDDIFNEFKQEATQKFETFRDKCNKEYTDFVRKAWKEFHGEEPIQAPEKKEVVPVACVENDNTETNSFLFFFGKKKKNKADDVVREPEKVLQAAMPTAKPVEEIKEIPVPADEKEYSTMPFTFFGTELEVRLDETKRINLGKIDPNRIGDALDFFSTRAFDNLVYDCLKIKKERQLCDWAYMKMLETICDQYYGPETNEGALLMGYLYYQSGYKIRFASTVDDNPRIFLLLGCKQTIFGKPFFKIDGDQYFPVSDGMPNRVLISQAKFPREEGLSLFIPTPQKIGDLTELATDERTITSPRFPDLSIKVTTNRNLIDFYESYPSSYFGGDTKSKWLFYAETPMDDNIKKQIYPTLKKDIEGRSEIEAVNRLLNFVQMGLSYEIDEVVWGHDRPFFAEETLFYPLCDCEDRAILLTRLVRDLLGLKCVLVYYPGHLACAIHFSQDFEGGTRYVHEGEDYVICDPTYFKAGVGLEMHTMVGKPVTLIPLKHTPVQI